MVENNKAKVLWDFKQLLASQPHIVVVDTEQKTTVVVDVAVPGDSNVRKGSTRKQRSSRD